jgi:hypothetical protein
MPQNNMQSQGPKDVSWDKGWYAGQIGGQGGFGPDPAAWEAAKQQALGSIAQQGAGMMYRLGQQGAAQGTSQSGMQMAGQRQIIADMNRAGSQALNQLAMQQQQMAQEDRWKRLAAASGQAGLDVQSAVAAKEAAIKQYLAEQTGMMNAADLAAQALDWTLWGQNQGYPFDLRQVQSFFGGTNPYYGAWPNAPTPAW